MATLNEAAISDTVIAYKKPVTIQMMRAMRDAIYAIAEGDATASARRIQRAAIQDAAINRVKISTTLVTSAYTVAAGGNLNVTLNPYCFLPALTNGASLLFGTALGETPVMRISNPTGGSISGDLIWRYINA